jgi:hypothetical protein
LAPPPEPTTVGSEPWGITHVSDIRTVFSVAVPGPLVLVAALYTWLTFERQVAIFGKEVRASDFVNAGADPDRSKRVARNLSNQFELPVFALFAAILIYVKGQVEMVDIIAAWTFFGGRLIHTAVQTLTHNVPLRGAVFTLTFLAVTALMARAAYGVLPFPL